MFTHIIINNAEIYKHMSNDYTIVKILIDLINNKYLISILYSNPYDDVEDTVENININIRIV